MFKLHFLKGLLIFIFIKECIFDLPNFVLCCCRWNCHKVSPESNKSKKQTDEEYKLCKVKSQRKTIKKIINGIVCSTGFSLSQPNRDFGINSLENPWTNTQSFIRDPFGTWSQCLSTCRHIENCEDHPGEVTEFNQLDRYLLCGKKYLTLPSDPPI